MRATWALLTRPMFFEVHRLSVFTPRSLDVDVVLDLMIHDLDIVLKMANSPVRELRAVGLPVLTGKVDIASVRIEFESGCIANFTASRISTERVRKLRFFQPAQYVSLDYSRRDVFSLTVKPTAAAFRRSRPTSRPSPTKNLCTPSCAAFCRPCASARSLRSLWRTGAPRSIWPSPSSSRWQSTRSAQASTRWPPPCAEPSQSGSSHLTYRSPTIESESHNPVAPPPPPEPQFSRLMQRRRVHDHDDPEFMPHMLAELEDELARSRKREAFWISVVVHIVLVLLIVFSPELLPNWAQPHLLRAEDLAHKEEPTFLTLPQDMQKPPAKVHTNKLSDKNRIAETRHPQIDRKTLETLRSARQPDAALAAARDAVHARAGAAGPARQLASDATSRPGYSPGCNPPSRRRKQPVANAFKMPGSAGDSIAQAARNTRRGPGGGYGGAGYGQGPDERREHVGGLDILSDTMGVDFGPYLRASTRRSRRNWMPLAPEAARPPLMKHGKVVDPPRHHARRQSGWHEHRIVLRRYCLDRAAWGSLTASSPFPPLPQRIPRPLPGTALPILLQPHHRRNGARAVARPGGPHPPSFGECRVAQFRVLGLGGALTLRSTLLFRTPKQAPGAPPSDARSFARLRWESMSPPQQALAVASDVLPVSPSFFAVLGWDAMPIARFA